MKHRNKESSKARSAVSFLDAGTYGGERYMYKNPIFPKRTIGEGVIRDSRVVSEFQVFTVENIIFFQYFSHSGRRSEIWWEKEFPKTG